MVQEVSTVNSLTELRNILKAKQKNRSAKIFALILSDPTNIKMRELLSDGKYLHSINYVSDKSIAIGVHIYEDSAEYKEKLLAEAREAQPGMLSFMTATNYYSPMKDNNLRSFLKSLEINEKELPLIYFFGYENDFDSSFKIQLFGQTKEELHKEITKVLELVKMEITQKNSGMKEIENALRVHEKRKSVNDFFSANFKKM